VKLRDFLLERYNPGSPSPASNPLQYALHSLLPDEVRKAANLGWQIYPVTLLAKLAGTPDLLMCEASSEVSCLEELAAKHRPCGWRIATGPSSLCIVRLDGPEGRQSFQALTQDCEECFTLRAHRGGTAWAYFRWPEGMVLRASAKKPALGVRILAEGDGCPIPPLDGCAWINPGAEPEALPYSLRELAFETPSSTPGKAAFVPAFYPRTSPCRVTARYEKHQGATRKGYPICGHVGGRGGFRISRRR
jgi:Bifunctional DNA primase/polymerase, N-terminal